MLAPKRLATLTAIAAVGLAIAGCGSSDIDGTIPQEDADQLVSDLDAIEAANASHDCRSAQARTREFLQHVDELPATSGVALKEALRGAGDNLEQLVDDPCGAGATGESGQQATDSESSDTGSTPPTTPPASSTTPTPSTTPSRTEPPAPPGDGQGQGGDEGAPPSDQGGGSQGGNDQGGGSQGGGTGGTGGTGVGGGA
jgi:hypothetical protein